MDHNVFPNESDDNVMLIDITLSSHDLIFAKDHVSLSKMGIIMNNLLVS